MTRALKDLILIMGVYARNILEERRRNVMLKKLGRGLITVIGGAFGYLAWLLIALGLNKSGNNVDKIFTSGQQTGVAIIFVIFFAIIFFRLAPS